MKVKVLKRFRDKYSGKVYDPNKTKTLVITKERYEEICKVDKTLVEAIGETAKAKNTAE